MRLADAYMALKNPAAARQSLNSALDITPKFLPAQRGLVLLDLSAGHPEQAMAVARKVQSERPDQSFGYLLAGDVEAFGKNWSAAAADYREGLNRGASTELASKLHSMLVLGQKRADADAFATGWIKEHPQDVAFRGYLGNLALDQKDYAAAETQLLAIVQTQPDNAVALNNLAWVTHQLKKPGAQAYAERAIALGPEQPDFIDTLATVLSDAGQQGKALDLEKKAVALAPDNHGFRLNLAKLYLKTGDKAQAKSELNQLVGLGDKFAGQAEVGALLKTL
jgi:putative PEP-CTERM system TPR-repeat lipoprotein